MWAYESLVINGFIGQYFVDTYNKYFKKHTTKHSMKIAADKYNRFEDELENSAKFIQMEPIEVKNKIKVEDDFDEVRL